MMPRKRKLSSEYSETADDVTLLIRLGNFDKVSDADLEDNGIICDPSPNDHDIRPDPLELLLPATLSRFATISQARPFNISPSYIGWAAAGKAIPADCYARFFKKYEELPEKFRDVFESSLKSLHLYTNHPSLWNRCGENAQTRAFVQQMWAIIDVATMDATDVVSDGSVPFDVPLKVLVPVPPAMSAQPLQLSDAVQYRMQACEADARVNASGIAAGSFWSTTAEFTPGGFVGFGRQTFLEQWLGTATSKLQVPTLIWESTTAAGAPTTIRDDAIEQKLIAEMVTAVHSQEAVLPAERHREAACLGFRIKSEKFYLLLAARDTNRDIHVWHLAHVEVSATIPYSQFHFLCLCVRVAMLARHQADLVAEALRMPHPGAFLERKRVVAEFESRGFVKRAAHNGKRRTTISDETQATSSTPDGGTGGRASKTRRIETSASDDTVDDQDDHHDDTAAAEPLLQPPTRRQSTKNSRYREVLEIAIAAIAGPLQLDDMSPRQCSVLAQTRRSIVGDCSSSLHFGVAVKCAKRHRIVREVQFWQRFLAVAHPFQPVLLYHMGSLPDAPDYGCLVTRQMAQASPTVHKPLVQICIQFLEQVRALKTAGIVHRDIKPDNVLTDYDVREIQLIDFDLAVDASSHSTPNAGTKGFVAPDILCSYASDVFGAGRTILYWIQMTYGSKYITGITADNIQYAIGWVPVDKVFVPLLRWMLQPDVEKRCTVEQALGMLHEHVSSCPVDRQV